MNFEPIFLLTGSSGIVGKELTKIFKENKISYINIYRDENNSWINSLKENYEILSRGTLYLIHSAIPPSPKSKSKRIEYYKNTKALFEYCNFLKIKIIFISSLSSFEKNKTIYSKEKKAIEQLSLVNNGQAIRIGLFKSESQQSALSRVNKLIEKSFMVRSIFFLTKRYFCITTRENFQEYFLNLAKKNNFENKKIIELHDENIYLIHFMNKKLVKKDFKELSHFDPGKLHGKTAVILYFIIQTLTYINNKYIDVVVNFLAGHQIHRGEFYEER